MTAAVLTALIIAGLSLPLILLAHWHTGSREYAWTVLAVGCFALYLTCKIFMSLTLRIPGLQWNWVGKLLGTALALVLIHALRTRITWEQCGLVWTIAPASLWPVAGWTLMLSAAQMVYRYAISGVSTPHLETLLYQATLPGLDEEIAFRGLLLGLGNAAFGRTWSVGGARVGWGAILTTTWFSMVHGIAYDAGTGMEVYWVPMLTSGLAGFVFAWIRERSGSVVPAIASHNFSNTVLKLLG